MKQEGQQFQVSNNSQGSQNGEISFVNILLVIIKWKWVVLLVTLFSILLLGVKTFSTKPFYQSYAVIQIGRISQLGEINNNVAIVNIENVNTLKQRLVEGYLTKNISTKTAFLYSVNVESTCSDVLRLIVKAGTPPEAQNYLNEVINRIMVDHDSLYNGIHNLQQERMVLLQKQINSTKLSEELRLDLGRQLNELKMSSLYSRPTRLLYGPTTSSPVQSSKKQKVFIVCFLGLVLGLSSAFVIEYLLSLYKQLNRKGVFKIKNG